MSHDAKWQWIMESNPDAFLIDEFSDAWIGIAYNASSPVAVYDMDKLLNILVQDEMSQEDAIDHVLYNIVGSFQGENYPIVMARFDGQYLAVTDLEEVEYDLDNEDQSPIISPGDSE